MKILLANKYFFPKGGSERVFFNEAALLNQAGHRVLFFSMRDERNQPCAQEAYFVDHIDYEKPMGSKEKIAQGLKILYSFEARRKIGELVDVERPDIAHLHNIHHQLSPSIIHALKNRGIPVVMTLHDYKMVCPAYLMVKDNIICEACKGGRYYRCLLGRCTKNSYVKSLVNTVEMYLHHKLLHVYDQVDIFISPSRFLKEKVMGMGFRNNIVHMPYSFNATHYRPQYGSGTQTFCYFGRLAAEKGLITLIRAVKGSEAKLKIIGRGPLKSTLEAEIEREKATNVHLLEYITGDALRSEISNCLAVIVPSEWYENYPNAILEAFALGKPVIGSRIGGIPEMVKDYDTGFTFEPGEAKDLRAKMNLLLQDHGLAVKLGRRAREFVENNLNPEEHYRGLMKIYEDIQVSSLRSQLVGVKF